MVGEMWALRWIVQGLRGWGAEVAGGGDKTGWRPGWGGSSKEKVHWELRGRAGMLSRDSAVMGSLWTSWFLSWALDYVFKREVGSQASPGLTLPQGDQRQVPAKDPRPPPSPLSSTIQSKHWVAGFAKDIHTIAYLEAMSTVWWCQFHLQVNKVLNTPSCCC